MSASVLMAHMKSKPTLQELQEVIESNDKVRHTISNCTIRWFNVSK